jgi:hypothetical protein
LTENLITQDSNTSLSKAILNAFNEKAVDTISVWRHINFYPGTPNPAHLTQVWWLRQKPCKVHGSVSHDKARTLKRMNPMDVLVCRTRKAYIKIQTNELVKLRMLPYTWKRPSPSRVYSPQLHQGELPKPAVNKQPNLSNTFNLCLTCANWNAWLFLACRAPLTLCLGEFWPRSSLPGGDHNETPPHSPRSPLIPWLLLSSGLCYLHFEPHASPKLACRYLIFCSRTLNLKGH